MNNLKTYLITILLLGASLYSSGQSWVSMMNDSNANFYSIQKSFNEYWEGKKIPKGKGWKQFKRWENFMAPRVYPSGNMDITANLWTEYQKLKNQESILRVKETATWQPLGTYSIPPNGGGAGRLNCVAFHPLDSNIIFAGAPAGGLWKTTNGGITWTTNTDLLPNLGVSSIVIDPKDPNIMYIATGDGDAGDTYSIGVLKSIDGGATWNATGLTWNVSQSKNVNKLLIHPTNTDTIYAATSAGIYRSLNAGNTFTLERSGNFKDIEFKPDNPSIIWSCTLTRIWKSIDAGDTFSLNAAFTPVNVSRIAIAVTANDPNYLYALTGNNSDNGLEGVYKTTDLGTTFTTCVTSPNLLGWETNGSDAGGQAWYDLSIAVSPTDKNTVYVGGVNIWKSTDGGSSWNLNAHWYGGGGKPYVHADVHTLEFYPGSGSTIFAGCDGGLFKTTNGGSSWDDKSSGLMIGQIYKLGCSATDPDLVLTGWQDNGSNLYSASSCDNVLGGDGMECMIDYSNTNYMYGEVYYGNIYKSSDGGSSWSSIKNNISEEGGWVTPFVIDPQNPQIIYAGYHNLWKSTNRGNSWTQISSFAGGNKIVSIAVSPVSSNTIYICTDSYVYKTTDGGTNWTSIGYGSGAGTGLPSLYFTYLITSPTDPDVVWISMSGYTNGHKVYMTRNGGAIWTNYTGTLPNIPANCLVYENGTNEGIYVGTDLGVFYRDSMMTDWVSFNNNLPNVIINELEIQYSSGKLRAATYGRGLWETDLYSIVSTPESHTKNLSFKVFPNPTNGKIKIYYAENNEEIREISIYNYSGILVYSENFNTKNCRNEIDLSNESNGLFLIKITTSKNNVISQTFIKN